MVKTIVISGRSYDMKSSAFTAFAYRDQTGREILADLQKISKTTDDLQTVNNSIEIILDVAYCMIKEFNPNFKDFNSWLSEIDNLFDDPSWIQEVVALATNPFRRSIPNEQIK